MAQKVRRVGQFDEERVEGGGGHLVVEAVQQLMLLVREEVQERDFLKFIRPK